MRFEDMTAELKELAVTVAPGTIRRWATEKLVKPPTRNPRSKGEGRGTTSDWSDQALEEIAAIWAIKSFAFAGGALSNNAARAKEWAELFYRDPISWELQEKYRLQRERYLGGGYGEPYPRREKDGPLIRQFVWLHSIGTLDARRLKAQKEALRRSIALWNRHFAIFTEWVAAIEKVRRGCPVPTPVDVTFCFCSQGSTEDKTLEYRFLGVDVKKRGGRLIEGSRIKVRIEGERATLEENKNTIDYQTQLQT
ncbi:MAG: hypothetical protein WB581_06270 [Halobacteriota archaeon]